ncbi:MAG: hypothetical protein M1827_000968 [Pycnora praestabilis]|nr:MAG: hypothetical protein M1827_000968 [Pycnora praestabilis]
MRTLDRLDFLSWRLKTETLGACRPKIKEYEYDRQLPTRPIIPLAALKHFYNDPTSTSTQPLHLKRDPKKTNGELVWLRGGGEEEGRGLRFRERLCWTKVFIAEGYWAMLALGFTFL